MSMERSELSVFLNKARPNGKGVIKRFGARNTAEGRILTFLLVDTKVWNDEVEIETDHLWIAINKKIDPKNLRIGDEVSFTCKVREYSKGGDHTAFHAYGIGKIRNLKIDAHGRGQKVTEHLKRIINREDSFAKHSLVI